MADSKNSKPKNTDNQDTIVFSTSSFGNSQQGQVPPQQQYYQQGQVPPQQYYQQGHVPPQQYYQQGHVPPQQYYQQGQVPPQQYYQQGQVPPQQYYQQQYYANAPQGHPYQQGQYYPNVPAGHPYSNGQPQQPSPKCKNGKPPKQSKPKKHKKHKSLLWKIIRRVLLSLLILCLLLFGIYSCTSLSVIKKMKRVPTGERSRTEGAMTEKYVTSVLLIGTDGRTENDRGRSDSMILISLNSKTNEITLTSFLRDSYVDIPGRGKDKLNAAYAYGGPELLMDTIESNFDVRIDDYISLNFSTFASVIDSAGGVTIDVSDEEAEAINVILMSEVNELMGDDRDADLLSSGGTLHLNGKQALSYSRIRSVGRWDFERTSRQRKVISAMIKKASSNGISFVSKLTKNALPHVTTNMDKGELYLLSLRIPLALRYDVKQLQIPAEGTYSPISDTPSGDVLEVDFSQNIAIIEKQVFSD